MVNVAVLGYGTVGSGVVEVLRTNEKVIDERVGDKLNLRYVLDLREFPGDPVEDVLVHDFETIVSDPEVDIVVEVMGGINPAFTFVKQALEAGKSVATSNKALVEKHGSELLAVAEANSVSFLYEASVGGGIPIIRPLHASLTGDVIDEISGILNGTTNYMLSKMFFEGADYDVVLKDAQQKGYAEANPAADVEGDDAGRKIAILSSIISGYKVDYEALYVEGITDITATDIRYAKEMGMVIKLLATAKRIDDKISAYVAPCLLESEHPLYSVNDVFNAIFVHGNMLGDAMFYGSGAGKLPTASAVVGDIVEAAKNLHKSVMPTWSEEKLELESFDKVERSFFVRISGDEDARLAEVEQAFGKVRVVKADGVEGEFGVVTGTMSEGAYKEAAAQLDGIIHMIRI